MLIDELSFLSSTIFDNPGGTNRTVSSVLPEPQLKPILELHRGGDGFVTFHRNSKGWQDLCSIRADKLDGSFSSIRPELRYDAYFSINGFYRAHWRRGKLGLPGAFRKTEGLRYLNAAFVDLDFYKRGDSRGSVLIEVNRMQDSGAIPSPSIIGYSGRGIWVFWLLRDTQNPLQPPRAWSNSLRSYNRIQHALAERLSPLGSDMGARDPVRVTRVPGSMNTKGNRQVAYWVRHDGQAQVLTYTIDELVLLLGLDLKPQLRQVGNHGWPANSARSDTKMAPLGKRKPGAGRAGRDALYASRLRQFELLRRLRCGFREGCRNRAALLYTHILKASEFEERRIHERLARFSTECSPPLSDSECLRAVKGGTSGKLRRFSDQKISEWLLITHEESEQLETWKAATGFVPFSSSNDSRLGTGKQKQRISSRRAAIVDLVKEAGEVPSVRKMAGLLAMQGVHAGHVTVFHDYKALRLSSRRRHRRTMPDESLKKR